MCLLKYTPSRLTYVLARETYAIQDICHKLLLSITAAYDDLQQLNAKREEIWLKFYCTDAMGNTESMGVNYTLRHLMMRFAVHGFQHKDM
jgi:hypothetical protein